jgi:hypothetical protein
VGIATWYRLVVEGPSGTVMNDWHKASRVCDRSSSTCLVTPTVVLTDGGYRWWVKTWNPHGAGPWSSRLDFSVTSAGAGSSGPPREYRLYLPSVLRSAEGEEGPPSEGGPAPPTEDEADVPPLADDLAAQVTVETAPALFKAAVGQGEPDTADDPTILRACWVEVDTAVLAGLSGPPGSELGGAPYLRLDLFEGAVFTAVLDRELARAPDGLTWIGHVDGVADSRVILRVEGEAMIEEIALPGTLYRVRHVGMACMPFMESAHQTFPEDRAK